MTGRRRTGRAFLLGVGLLVSAAAFDVLAVCQSALSTEHAVDGAGVESHRRAIEMHRRVIDSAFRDPVSSPLLSVDLARFEGLNYFPIDDGYLLSARFESAPGARLFELPTFNGERQRYREFGTLSFCSFDGRPATLTLFQRDDLGEVGRLTVIAPFRDASNGSETYSGGRYLKFLLPLGDRPRIDFNRAVNPYCAYNPNLPCPIPPKRNWLPFAVLAGERAFAGAD